MRTDTRYITSWVDLCHETTISDTEGQTEQQVVEALRQWFKEAAPQGWIAFQVCLASQLTQEQG